MGERLFDRSTKDATLTDAGRLLRDYAERLLRLSEEAEIAVQDLRDLRRGRVLIGANEASVHVVLPLIARFRESHPLVHVDVRRIPARQIGAEVSQGTLDFGVLTFQPAEPKLSSIVLGHDELVMLVPPTHTLAAQQGSDARRIRPRSRSSRTTIHRTCATGCCACSSSITFRPTSWCRCRASKGSNARWR